MTQFTTSALATALILAGTSFAETINVPGDYGTIQGAIKASSNGDVIAIAAGTYNEHSLNPSGTAETNVNGDVDCDGDYDIDDIYAGMEHFGIDEAGQTCDADLDSDGDVDIHDLLVLIAAWGVCP